MCWQRRQTASPTQSIFRTALFTYSTPRMVRCWGGTRPGGMPVEAFRELNVAVADDPFMAEIVDKRRPIAVLDTTNDPRCDLEQPTVAGAKSVLGLPLIARDELQGVAVVATFERPYEFHQAQVT